MKTIIYGLIDPNTHEIRYVGQARNPHSRFSAHLSRAKCKNTPRDEWIRSLAPLLPILVILEHVDRKLAAAMEAKWIKRHRRTVLNMTKGRAAAWDDFVNPPELQKRYGLKAKKWRK